MSAPRGAVPAAAVLLLAVNLRTAVASVGPVLADVQADLGLSGTAAAVLGALPVLCFGLASALAGPLARRLGPDRALVAALALTVAGLLLRLGPSSLTLFTGTLVAGAGTAVGNVLLPALVKRDFPDRTGPMMGAYAVSLAVGASLAAGATVPAVEALGGGWRTGLGVWAVPAAVALVVWLPLVRTRGRAPAPPPGAPRPSALGKDRLAWQVTAFMGLQSLGFYSVLAWLPSVFRDEGLSAAAAGGLLGVLAAVGIPVGLVVPSLLARRSDQRGWVAGICAVTMVALLGVALAPGAAPLLWAVLLGVGQGSAFPAALTLVVLRSRDAVDAARLSAMSQGVGYCVAAAGPLVVGALRDASGSWRLPFLLLAGLLVAQLCAGLAAGRHRFVGATAPAR